MLARLLSGFPGLAILGGRGIGDRVGDPDDHAGSHRHVGIRFSADRRTAVVKRSEGQQHGFPAPQPDFFGPEFEPGSHGIAEVGIGRQLQRLAEHPGAIGVTGDNDFLQLKIGITGPHGKPDPRIDRHAQLLGHRIHNPDFGGEIGDHGHRTGSVRLAGLAVTGHHGQAIMRIAGGLACAIQLQSKPATSGDVVQLFHGHGVDQFEITPGLLLQQFERAGPKWRIGHGQYLDAGPFEGLDFAAAGHRAGFQARVIRRLVGNRVDRHHGR